MMLRTLNDRPNAEQLVQELIGYEIASLGQRRAA